MGRVPMFLDVGTFMKVAATVAMALLAYGAMASPAWAQDTTLSVEKSAAPDPVGAGQELTYTIVVTNTGTEEAENAWLSDVMDFGDVTHGSVTASSPDGQVNCRVVAPTDAECSLGQHLEPGQKVTVTIKVVPNSTGTITNTATVTADNAATVQKTVNTQVVQYVTTLSVEKSAAPDPVEVGQELTYTIVVTNTGTVNYAQFVKIEDVMDLGDATIDPDSVSVSTTKGICQVDAPTIVACEIPSSAGNLAPGEKATVTIKLTPTSPGTITNTVTASANDVAPVKDVITTTVVSDLAGGPEPGENPSGGRVLVDHMGKELCLPKAALKGHERHGDEVISEEGCSNASSAKNGKGGRDEGASGKAL